MDFERCRALRSVPEIPVSIREENPPEQGAQGILGEQLVEVSLRGGAKGRASRQLDTCRRLGRKCNLSALSAQSACVRSRARITDEITMFPGCHFQRDSTWIQKLSRALTVLMLAGYNTIFAGVADSPPVPHITVVAKNPVEGLRVLAEQKDASFQVLLWRADQYLGEQFRDTSFETVKAVLDAAGAEQLEEWGEEDQSAQHLVRYVVKKGVFKSHVGRRHDLLVELRHFRKSNVTSVNAVLLVEFGLDFKKVAAGRDYPRGTVLDRIFGIIDLERRAKETPRLDRIEVSFGPIGYASTPGLGHGFHIEVHLSNPTPQGRLNDQRVYYMACSGLEPLGTFSTQKSDKKPEVHVARDVLVPGAALGDLHEHGYPDTFGSTGSGESPRESRSGVQ